MNDFIKLVVFLVLVIAAALILNDVAGVPSEPAACEVGPMEAAQCRAQRPVTRAKRMWEATP